MSIATTAADRPLTARLSWRRLWPALTRRDPALLQGRIGPWRWPWVVLATSLAFVGITVAAVAAIELLSEIAGDAALTDGTELDPQRPWSFLAMLLRFLPMIFVPCLLVRYLHKVSWRHLIAASGRFDWRVYLRAAAAYFVVLSVIPAVHYAVDPNAFRLIRRGLDFLPWFVLGLAVVFVQTLAEEIFFRGYLLRIWGAVFPYPVLAISIVTGVFVAGHFGNSDFNSDFWFTLVSFTLMQILWSYVWLRTQSIAASAGLHWANNVFIIFVLASEQSTSMAIASVTGVVLEGGSHLFEPGSWAVLFVQFGLLVPLLLWRRSPFYVPPAQTPQPATAAADLSRNARRSGAVE